MGHTKMTGNVLTEASLAKGLLEGLVEVGVNLSGHKNAQAIYNGVLAEARKIAHAEAGAIYVLDGDNFVVAAAQNDSPEGDDLVKARLDVTHRVDGESIVAFAASTGRILNIPDAGNLPEGAPYRVDRDQDAACGYATRSIVAVPMVIPSGESIGVLELVNCVDSQGQVGQFPAEANAAVSSLATMAAVTVHNHRIQEDLKTAQLDCIIRLSVAAEFRDDDTAEHILRISRTATIIAETLGLGADMVELIQHASPMHDIGKIGIPDAILRKPGPLTFEERNIVEKHTLIGADILADPPNELISVARDIALTHHERWDGKGYPNGAAGNDIPLPGRIVSLADVFDALVSKRCYKEAFAMEIALEIMRFEDGKHFDPDVAAAFFSVLPEVLKFYGELGKVGDAL
jgi:HD-GYP domain-containing protein (c-di-GMP phosphodiesterase class II)